MAITAASVKELREKTGAGMMDCKKALTETGGDFEQAVDWLRKKGLSAAAKKSDRVAAEGLVALKLNAAQTQGVLVEINAETDFVAKNEKFQDVAMGIASLALEKATVDVEKLKQLKYPGSERNVEDQIKELVGVIGENMQLRRSSAISGDVLATYIHNTIAPGLGKVGVIVALSTEGDKEKAQAFGKQVAMHIAAMKPEALNVEELDPALIERERDIFAEQARASGKPDNVIEKMIEGRIRKFYAEVVLLEQAFIIDGKTPIHAALSEAEKEIGGSTKITGYKRFTLGEGVEKKAENFADEVAKTAGH